MFDVPTLNAEEELMKRLSALVEINGDHRKAGGPMKTKIRIFLLAVRYFRQGDDWQFAKEYAAFIINGLKNRGE